MNETKNNRLITMTAVTKHYQTDKNETVTALSDVNLTIEDGQFITIIGPTGCGKTTLLNLIAGILPCDDGTVTVANDLQLGKSIGCVFQNYRLFPWLNAMDNVAFGLKMQGMSKSLRHERARSLLQEVGLERFEKAYPHELSGGMRQRVAIAQALAIEPKLLLMDEPFGALDDRTRMELQNVLITLWRKHETTVLFVTHNLDEAVLLGNRVLTFSDRPGRLQDDTVIDLDRPRDRLSDEFSQIVMDLRKQLHGTLQ